MFHSIRETCTGMTVLAVVFFAAPVFAQDSQADLRTQIELLRQQLDALQQKVAALEAAQRPAGATPAPAPAPVPTPAPGAPVTVETPPGAAGAAGPSGPLPVYGNTSALSKIFNPDISVIGNFVGAAGSNDAEPRPALQLGEAELSLQAIVDPYARADFFLAASPEGLEIEEGFLTFPTLPGGLLAKVGKMKAQFGKANTFHSHNLPWVDAPLPIKNLLGGDEGLNDSGVSVSKLIPNSGALPRSHRRDLQRHERPVHRTRAQRSHISGTPARLSRSDRVHQPGRRHVVRLRPQRRRSRFDDAGVRRGRDVPIPPAAPRDLPPVPRRVRSCSGAAATTGSTAARRSAPTSAASISSRGAGSPARATTSPIAPSTRRCATRAARCC